MTECRGQFTGVQPFDKHVPAHEMDSLSCVLISLGGIVKMGLQTDCNGRSRKPRDELFDQLPAYKLHRPDH
jgi:hypothetical protein